MIFRHRDGKDGSLNIDAMPDDDEFIGLIRTRRNTLLTDAVEHAEWTYISA